MSLAKLVVAQFLACRTLFDGVNARSAVEWAQRTSYCHKRPYEIDCVTLSGPCGGPGLQHRVFVSGLRFWPGQNCDKPSHSRVLQGILRQLLLMFRQWSSGPGLTCP